MNSSRIFFFFRHAYVNFSTPEAALKAFNVMSGQTLDGAKIKMKFIPYIEAPGKGIFVNIYVMLAPFYLISIQLDKYILNP